MDQLSSGQLSSALSSSILSKKTTDKPDITVRIRGYTPGERLYMTWKEEKDLGHGSTSGGNDCF